MNTNKPIELNNIVKSIMCHKGLFFKGLSLSFVLSCCLILCVPRYYSCNVSLAPETLNTSSSSLSSLASSFGVNMSGKLGELSDAFFPEIYPDILKTTNFQLELFPIPVKTIDNKVNTTYYKYLEKYQKYPWWTKFVVAVMQVFNKDDSVIRKQKQINPFMLSKKQLDIMGLISEKINCDVDKRTGIIYICVKDQDPLVCATMADSVRSKLQKFIIDYRTSKARADMEYTHGLCLVAKQQYERARQKYAAYSDSHVDAILTSVNSMREDLENEMQLQYNNYNNWATQYQSAVARVRERTPAFTVLQTACVPIKPTGPRRIIFVLAVLFVTFIGLTIYSVYKDLKIQTTK